ncbi:MAG: NAD(P)-dependent oxidoreductase [Bacteroidota bacterium]
MKAVVTGSSGFLGSAFAHALRQLEAEVVGIDLQAPTDELAIQADLSRAGEWMRAFEDADLVIHTAARVGEVGTRAQFRAQNVDTTANVIAACDRAGVGRLLHLSSIVVHGTAFPDPCPEDHPVQPTGNPYTDTKIASEHAVLAAHAAGRVRATVIRPGDVYGPGSQQWTVRAIEMMQSGTFALVDGNRGVLSPVFVRDLIAGGLAAAQSEAGVGQVFHITGGVGVPPRVFFGHYARMLGVRLRSVPPRVARVAAPLVAVASRAIGRDPILSGRTLEYVTHPGTYSIERANQVLGWRPTVSLADGMAETERWLRAEGRI